MVINFRQKSNVFRLSLLCLGILSTPVQMVQAKSLEESVATAFNTNPELRQVYHQYKVSEQVHQGANSGWYPSLDLQASIGTGEQDTASSRSGLEDESIEPVEWSVTLRQLLFDGFFTANETERTEQEVYSELFNLEAKAENVALDVARAYLDVLRQQQLHVLSQKNLVSHEEIFAQIKLRTDSGLGSASELAQAAGRLARANANVISALNQVQDANSSYVTLVGESPQGLVLPVADQRLIPLDKENLLSKALTEHPTIKSAEADVAATKAQYDASRSSYSPTVSLELSQNRVDDNNFNNALEDELKAEIVLSYNLFRGGRDKANIRANAYKIEEAKDIMVAAQRDVVEGAKLSWQAMSSLGQQLEYLKIHVEQSYITQQAYKKQFDLGRRTLLDLLDTENELFQARRNFVNAEADHLIAKYRVLNASGQLLSGLHINPQEYWQRAQ